MPTLIDGMFGVESTKDIKNMGWLARHVDEVLRVEVRPLANPRVTLEAHLTGQRRFIAHFNDKDVCREWLRARRGLKGILLTFLGADTECDAKEDV